MKRFVTVATVILAAAWCLVALLSWLLSALMVGGVRPLLSGEGVRWLFAHSADTLSSPFLAWLLTAALACGCVSGSRLLKGEGAYRRRAALRVATAALMLYAAVIALLTVPPHAVLLSATGTLADSPFSRAIVPVASLGVAIFSVAYGIAAHTMATATDMTEALVEGLRGAAPLILMYIMAAQLAHTLLYVFG